MLCWCREQQSLIVADGLWTVMSEKLLSTGQPLSIATFNSLSEVKIVYVDLNTILLYIYCIFSSCWVGHPVILQSLVSSHWMLLMK